MFGLSGEHLLILAGILLIFGPRKLPELGSSVGKALRNFKEGMNGLSSSQGTLESRNVSQPAAPGASVKKEEVKVATSATSAAPAAEASPETPANS